MKAAINRIFRLVVKEFRTVWGDKRSRIIIIAPTMIQLFILSFAATHEMKNASLGVFLEDEGLQGREFISRFEAIPTTFSRVKRYGSLGDVGKAIEKQEVIGVVHVGPKFSAEMETGKTASVQLLLDGRKANAAMITQGYISRIADQFSSEKSGRTSLVTVVPRMWFNQNLDPLWSSVPALLGMLANLVAVIITSLSIARERELGTFEQLLVSPLRPLEILVGKTIPAIIISFAEGCGMILLAVTVFRIPFNGSLILLLGALLLFLFAIVGVGLFISSLAKTQQQGFLGAFTYFVPAILLSGFATPVENIPDWLRFIAYGNPLKYMVSISRAVFLEAPTTVEVIKMAIPLIPIGIFTLAAATLLFRKRME